MNRVLPGILSASSFDPPVKSAETAEIALIGYQDQGNLGMGYLSAVLQRRGHSVLMIDVRDGAEKIAERLVTRRPLVVGFSLIFQVFLPQFRKLARRLRAAGINSHFTIGGHFPSLCPDEVLKHFPEVDSVVRFEGEDTLVDLVDRLLGNRDWRETPGLAFLKEGQIAESEPRSLVEDLDSLPYPYRPFEPEQIGGFPTLPLLASRGCARRCSFCSIHTFYRTAPGKVVRVRKPAKVVEEMLHLLQEHSVRIILFQDDDFPIWGPAGRRWAEELVGRMHDAGLPERMIWKISCRAEYLEYELFKKLRDAGLFLVYMGLESGTEQGLKVLNKQMSVEQNLAAVRTLKELDLNVSYGFMLFDPSSTFESVRENLAFLKNVTGDGRAAAVFSRMLPYGGTPIRDALKKEGRLRGDLTRPDYVFLDLRLNEFYDLLMPTVRPWIHRQGFTYQLDYAWDEFTTVTRLTRGLEGIEEYRNELQSLTKDANASLFQHVEKCLDAFEQGYRSQLTAGPARAHCEAGVKQLLALRNRFIARNVQVLVDEVSADCKSGPVLIPQVH